MCKMRCVFIGKASMCSDYGYFSNWSIVKNPRSVNVKLKRPFYQWLSIIAPARVNIYISINPQDAIQRVPGNSHETTHRNIYLEYEATSRVGKDGILFQGNEGEPPREMAMMKRRYWVAFLRRTMSNLKIQTPTLRERWWLFCMC